MYGNYSGSTYGMLGGGYSPFGQDQFNQFQQFKQLNTDGQNVTYGYNPLDVSGVNQQPQAKTDTGSGGSGGELGMNLKTFGLGMDALKLGAGLYLGLKNNKLANKQFNMQKDLAYKNYNNTVSDYNRKLGDINRTRGQYEGQSQEQQDNYYNQHKLG